MMMGLATGPPRSYLSLAPSFPRGQVILRMAHLSRLVGSEDEDLHSVLAGAGFDHRRITMSDVSASCMALPETINKEGSKRRGDGGREDDEREEEGFLGRAGQVGTQLVGLGSIQMGLYVIIFF
ncbi:hypothetical protein HN51_035420 [Arachis hypogaea]|nr:uncharacterized protein DS421_13g406890 [Arachis hypogaea]